MSEKGMAQSLVASIPPGVHIEDPNCVCETCLRWRKEAMCPVSEDGVHIVPSITGNNCLLCGRKILA